MSLRTQETCSFRVYENSYITSLPENATCKVNRKSILNMCMLQLHMQCIDQFFEVVPEEKESAELVVEDAVSRILLDLFGGGIVDDIAIHFARNPLLRLHRCFIRVNVPC